MPPKAPKVPTAAPPWSASQAAASPYNGSRRTTAIAKCIMSAPLVIRRDMVRCIMGITDVRSGISFKIDPERVHHAMVIGLVRCGHQFRRAAVFKAR